MKEAEKNEENTNQILSFTKKIKESDYKFKSKVIEALWRVIFSNILLGFFKVDNESFLLFSFF